ncbi:MAG: fibronectin type III domain-containing protein, partial [Endomicrobiia bacterium]
NQWENIWEKYNITTTTVSYDGDNLTDGHYYAYTINAYDSNGNASSKIFYFSYKAGADRLLVLLPGETKNVNSFSGKTGTPLQQVAYSTFTVTVEAVNKIWAIDTGFASDITLTAYKDAQTVISTISATNGIAVFNNVSLAEGYYSIVSTATNFSSDTSYLTVVPLTIPAPSNFTGTAFSSTSIRWNWIDNADNETGYLVKTATDGVIAELDANTTFWIETDLLPNTSYYRYVQAFKYTAVSQPSGGLRFTLANPPTGSEIVAVTSGSVSILWSANNNPDWTQYQVESSSVASDFTSVVSFSGWTNQINCVVTSLQPSTTYWFRVQSRNGDGIPTSFDTPISTITLPAPPIAPTNFTGTAISTSSIKWEWSITPGATYYQIYGSNNQLLLNLEGTDTTTWIEIGLTANTQYSRYIRAGNVSGLSSPSLSASKHTFANAPSDLSISTSSAHSITINSSGNGGTRFRILCSTSVDFSSPVKDLEWSAAIITSSFTVTNLTPLTTYYFAVYGYNGDGIQTLNSATAVGTTQGLPQKVTIITPAETKTITETKTTTEGTNLEVKVEVLAGAVTKQIYVEVSVDPVNKPIIVDAGKITTANNKITPTTNKKILSDTITEFVAKDYATGEKFAENFIENTVSIILSYPDADNDGFVDGIEPKMSEKSLKIHMLNETTDIWEEVGGTVDTANNKVKVSVRHFSVYALMSVKTVSLNLNEVKVYPNPYKHGATGDNAKFSDSSLGTGIVFDNLTLKAEIKIYNISGELVSELSENDGDGMCLWNTKNKDGEKVVSGVYIYYVTNPDDKGMKPAKGKFAIIR